MKIHLRQNEKLEVIMLSERSQGVIIYDHTYLCMESTIATDLIEAEWNGSYQSVWQCLGSCQSNDIKL